jgi:hypothetical protein
VHGTSTARDSTSNSVRSILKRREEESMTLCTLCPISQLFDPKEIRTSERFVNISPAADTLP